MSCAALSPEAASRALASDFNRSCFCISLDRDQLAAHMREASGDANFVEAHLSSRPHLFSNLPVFLPRADRDAMLEIVAAIEETVRLPGYQQAALADAPTIAQRDFGPRGAFMGYDFHLADGTPRLIEVNTNAGGAFLNALSMQAQIACCEEVANAVASSRPVAFDAAIVAMFKAEWRLQRHTGKPRTIAIVDDAPKDQYLYPEFLLAQRMLERAGMTTLIIDPSDLAFDGQTLRAGNTSIDLVYNRLVDFDLARPDHHALRTAYEAGAVVVTPNPHNHALFAEKRNLTRLTDPAMLETWGASPVAMRALASIPQAVRVTAENADALWTARKTLFFKPVAGHGGKAVYRGDKLTRATWDEIRKGGYIAQELAPPGERLIKLGNETVARKVDVRLYTYNGRLLLAAARLYQGQTTNFRTEGGGFAPVFFI